VWIYLAPASSANVTKASNASAGNVMQVSGGSDKTLNDFVSAGGIIKVSPTGLVSIAVAGTDYVTGASANTFTNKTIDATGTGNSITNIGLTNFISGLITSVVNGSSTASQIPTALAVNSAIAAALSGVAKPMGGIDCSTNPNYPAANVGEFYRVTVAGLIGGASGLNVEVGDELHCFLTGTTGSQATVGNNWTIVQANVSQATATVLGLTAYATQAETEGKTVTNKAVVPASLLAFTQKRIASIGDGILTSFTVNDNLNTLDKVAIVRDATTNAEIECERVYALNSVTFSGWLVAPVLNAYKVVILG
jgi:hypothetical protein